jgi:signal transduction histidine kinase/CheY-like chemotaxis protein
MYHIAGTQPAVILAPQGIAIAAALLFGYATIPITALGAFCAAVYSGNPVIIASLSFVANFLEASITLYLVDTWKISRNLSSGWDFYRYIAIVFFTSAIVPIISSYGRELYNRSVEAAANPLVLSNVWVAGLVSTLILTPFLVRVQRPHRRFTKAEWIENIVAIVLLNIPTTILTYTPITTLYGINLLIPFILFLMWTALRGGTFFVTFAMLTVSISAISGRILGNPSNPQMLDLPSQIVNAEISLIVFSLFFYFIAAVEEGRRSAYENLQTLYREMAAADKAKTTFISLLAHELRNPLAPILSSIEYLKLQEPKTEVIGVVDTMSLNVSMMRRLLDDLLDIARLDQGRLDLRKSSVRVKELVSQSVASVQDFADKRDVAIRVSSDADSVVLHADPVRLKQVLINVLNNACKFTEPGGTVELSVKKNSESLQLQIKDSGIGITSDLLPILFEPFKVGPASRQGTGLGIGLFLTKHLVELHNGTLEVESPGENQGSTFTVHLPLSVAPLARESDVSVVHPESTRILVVDDNETAAYGLKRLLEHHGHNVQTAFTGSEALGIVPHFKPEFILLDIGLPDMSGYDVSKTLRSSGFDHRIVALTGFGQESDVRHSQQSGFDRHLVKPASINDVLATIADLRTKTAVAS